MHSSYICVFVCIYFYHVIIIYEILILEIDVKYHQKKQRNTIVIFILYIFIVYKSDTKKIFTLYRLFQKFLVITN